MPKTTHLRTLSSSSLHRAAAGATAIEYVLRVTAGTSGTAGTTVAIIGITPAAR